jgi:UDP-glucose 4-epimerase
MTILVTGGAGFIGSHMVHALVDAGKEVVVLDNLSTGFRWAIPAVPLIVGETGSRELVERTLRHHGVTDIIHFAASTVVPESVADPLTYYLNNTANSRTLLEAAVRSGVSNLVFSSTAAVYGNPARVPVQEDDAVAPLSPYGWSKAMTETMIRDTARAHGMRHVILRYFNVAGADPALRTGQSTRNATHLIKVAVEAALGKRAGIEVFGRDYPTPDGTCIRDYIHVCDLVAAHQQVLDYLRDGGDSLTLNCGYGRGYSVLDVIKAVEEETGSKLLVRDAARRAGDCMTVVACCDRMRDTIGWRPRHDDLRTIVRHALAWENCLRKNAGGARVLAGVN